MTYFEYKNNYTGDNRIFSNKEIADMSVREAFKNKDAIMAQYAQIGIPSEQELQSSDSVIYVESYTRSDGTEVRTHWRSKPDGIESNNLSFNTSAQSGKSTGGASEISGIKEDGIIIKSAANINEEKNKLIAEKRQSKQK